MNFYYWHKKKARKGIEKKPQIKKLRCAILDL
jgi:hypothetical protein